MADCGREEVLVRGWRDAAVKRGDVVGMRVLRVRQCSPAGRTRTEPWGMGYWCGAAGCMYGTGRTESQENIEMGFLVFLICLFCT